MQNARFKMNAISKDVNEGVVGGVEEKEAWRTEGYGLARRHEVLGLGDGVPSRNFPEKLTSKCSLLRYDEEWNMSTV